MADLSRPDPNNYTTKTYDSATGQWSQGTSAYDPAAQGETGVGGMLGFSSTYRSPGYAVNRNTGYVGGDYGASRQAQGYYSALGNQGRGGASAYGNLGMDARGQQMDAAGMYRDLALGRGPSLAQMQMQQGLQQAQAAQASYAAGARGGGANLAAAQLGGATMAGQQALATNEAMGRERAQEQLAALGGYGNITGQARQQDMAGQEMMLGDARAYNQMLQQQQLGELNAQTQLEQTQGQLALQRQQQIAEEEKAAAQGNKDAAGMIVGGLGGVFGALGKMG